MKLAYTPANGERQEWEFDADNFRRIEAELIEESGGTQWETFGEWGALLNAGGFRAWCGALWIMLRRDNPTLKFEDVDPLVGELDFIRDDPKPESDEEPGKAEPTEPGTSPTDST